MMNALYYSLIYRFVNYCVKKDRKMFLIIPYFTEDHMK